MGAVFYHRYIYDYIVSRDHVFDHIANSVDATLMAGPGPAEGFGGLMMHLLPISRKVAYATQTLELPFSLCAEKKKQNVVQVGQRDVACTLHQVSRHRGCFP